jgi:ribulose-phosphate 3-epimerase
MKIRIAPSILSADFSRLGEEVKAVEAAGADLVHVDVMDGRFVPQITIGPGIVRDLKRCTRLPLDVHLMVEDPDRHVDAFAEAGAACITVHSEACIHLDRTLRHIKARGVRSGVAVNPATPLASVFYVLPLVDLVLVMSVNPGFGGQSLIDYSLAKVEAVRTEVKHRKLQTLIEVDGGVTAENAPRIVKAGADILVAGTAVFGAGDYAAAIAGLRSAAGPASQK